jgi:cholesterol oxidase
VERSAHLVRHHYTAEQVVVAAHAYGSSKLLHHMQHKGRLTGMSSQLGQRARTNSEQLLAITRTHAEWIRDPHRIQLTPGSVSITSAVWPDPVTSIEPVFWGLGSDLFALLVTEHQHGEQKHPTVNWLRDLAEDPGRVLGYDDARHWSERTVIMLCSQTTDASIELYWKDGLLHSRHGRGEAPQVHIPIVEDYVDRLTAKMGGHEGALIFEVINRGASAHFVGGIPIGETSDTGAVDPYLRVFGQAGLHVMDGSVMPANPGVNPSLTITALVERAMSLWPNKGEPDSRPPLGSGYEQVHAVPPHRPIVPAGAPGELRLDAKQSDVIPEYPY